MTLYYVKRKGDVYAVIEKDTDQTVATRVRYSGARSIASHFNAGGGFGGWTPSFIINTPLREVA